MTREFSDPAMVPEESWEDEVAAALAGLPLVEPPAGFIAEAVDHRPLFAGRLLVGLTGVAMLTFGLWYVTGAFGRPGIVPELRTLTARHAAAQAGGSEGVNPVSSSGFEEVAPEFSETPLRTTDDMDLRATFIAESDLVQVLYAHERQPVSIFSQPGRVKFDELPEGERVMIDGVLAWVDPDASVVVLETADSAVTIVGLSAAEVADAVQEIPHRSKTAGFTDLVNSITRELGFPDLS